MIDENYSFSANILLQLYKYSKSVDDVIGQKEYGEQILSLLISTDEIDTKSNKQIRVEKATVLKGVLDNSRENRWGIPAHDSQGLLGRFEKEDLKKRLEQVLYVYNRQESELLEFFQESPGHDFLMDLYFGIKKMDGTILPNSETEHLQNQYEQYQNESEKIEIAKIFLAVASSFKDSEHVKSQSDLRFITGRIAIEYGFINFSSFKDGSNNDDFREFLKSRTRLAINYLKEINRLP